MVDTCRLVSMVLLAAAVTGCGDDALDLDSGPAVDGADSSSAVTDDDAASDDAGVDDGAAEVEAGDDEDDGGGETTGGSAGGSSGPGEETAGAVPDVACLPAEVFDALQQHVSDLGTASYMLGGDPSAAMVTGFLLVPGLPMPPAVPFVNREIEPCQGPLALPVVCDLGVCTMIECTEDGWIAQLSIIPPLASDGWIYEEARARTRWFAGETGTVFRIGASGFTPFGTEISLSASGTMDVAGFAVQEEFPALHDAGTVVLTYSEGVDGVIGVLQIGEVITAEADASGQLQPTGECP